MTSPSETSPDIGNYKVGRGFLSMKLPTEMIYSDMGNCLEFTYEAKPTVLQHFSSRQGVQKQDSQLTTRLEATLSISLDEISGRNLALGLLGVLVDSPNLVIDIFSQPEYFASLQFTDTSVSGRTWYFQFPNVLITPKNAMSLIAKGSGDWQQIDLNAAVLIDQSTGKFGSASDVPFA